VETQIEDNELEVEVEVEVKEDLKKMKKSLRVSRRFWLREDELNYELWERCCYQEERLIDDDAKYQVRFTYPFSKDQEGSEEWKLMKQNR